jgi:hypothetical protein
MSSWLLPNILLAVSYSIVFFPASDVVFVFFAMAGKTRIEDDVLPWTVGVLFIRWKRTVANWASELKFSHEYSMDCGMQYHFPFLSQGQA